ncbi:MAG: alanyl-tRNA editing protein [Oligoflexia bacterium]|nr:alanyl-tRNA editing protein [Oligoflexia bacterium]
MTYSRYTYKMIPLYRSDPYLRECDTIVDRVLSTPEATIVFCREALFVEGGGQPMDFGSLQVDGQDYPLLKIVKEKGNTGYAIAPQAPISKGQKVHCVLDWQRRKGIMRLHSAQHALAGTLRLVRATILTGGMQIAKDATSCTVLYPTTSSLAEQEINQALSALSQIIKEDRKIYSESVESEEEAIKKFGELYRPTVASGSLKGKVRLIVIDRLDANACGGTHVKSLAEVGAVSIASIRDDTAGRHVTLVTSP